MSTNDRIKQIRQALNLTQVKFAEQIAISTGYLAAIELGTKKINKRIIQLIVNEFCVSEHWLTTGDGSMFDKSLNISTSKMLSFFKSLSPKFQEYALEQIKGLYDLECSLKP